MYDFHICSEARCTVFNPSSNFPAFANKTWRNWVVAGLAAAAFYKFAPAPGEETYLTRWIAHYSIDKSVWEHLNKKHLVLSAENQIENLIVADAQKPPVYRYRYPQCVPYPSSIAYRSM